MVETREHPVIYVRVAAEEQKKILAIPSVNNSFSYVSIGKTVSAKF